MALVRVTAAWMAGHEPHAVSHLLLLERARRDHLGGSVGLVAYFAGEAAVHAIERVGVGAAVVLGVAVVAAVVWVQVRERRELREQEQKLER